MHCLETTSSSWNCYSRVVGPNFYNFSDSRWLCSESSFTTVSFAGFVAFLVLDMVIGLSLIEISLFFGLNFPPSLQICAFVLLSRKCTLSTEVEPFFVRHCPLPPISNEAEISISVSNKAQTVHCRPFLTRLRHLHRSISSTIKHPTTTVLIKLLKLVKLELLSLVENMVEKNRNHFPIAVLLTTLICSH